MANRRPVRRFHDFKRVKTGPIQVTLECRDCGLTRLERRTDGVRIAGTAPEECVEWQRLQPGWKARQATRKPQEQKCPIYGHETYPARHCAACRADRLCGESS